MERKRQAEFIRFLEQLDRDNQPTLARKLDNEFHAWRLGGFKGVWHDHHQEIDGDHSPRGASRPATPGSPTT